MDPFLAEIRIFPTNFPPKGWAFCDGSLLAISQNTALFSLLGTNYGGDGKSTFGLPNLTGRAVMHYKQGPGLSDHDIGEVTGSETVTLQESEMPGHNHIVKVAGGEDAEVSKASENSFARTQGGMIYSSDNPNVNMNANAVTPVGGGLPHNNMMPYLALSFCIAMQGIFPPRP